MTTAPNRRAPLRRRLSPAACGPPAGPRAWAAAGARRSHLPAATLVQIARFDSRPSLAACRPVLGPAMPSPAPATSPRTPQHPRRPPRARAAARPPVRQGALGATLRPFHPPAVSVEAGRAEVRRGPGVKVRRERGEGRWRLPAGP